jgi:hypothetical protein
LQLVKGLKSKEIFFIPKLFWARTLSLAQLGPALITRVACSRDPAPAHPLGKESPALAHCHACPPCRLTGCPRLWHLATASPRRPQQTSHPCMLWAQRTVSMPNLHQARSRVTEKDLSPTDQIGEKNLNPQQTLESILDSAVDRMQDDSTTLPGLLALYKAIARARAHTDTPPLLPSLRGAEPWRCNLGLHRRCSQRNHGRSIIVSRTRHHRSSTELSHHC